MKNKKNNSTFKKSRRYNFSILETGKEFAKGKKREYPPGQHGQKRRRKLSDYALHLYEKQKLRFMYGVKEKQFKNTFKKASKLKGVISENFLRMLECRLDNIVYRLGFAKTRKQARQFVSHNHFTLNGKKANIPSMLVKVSDTIDVKNKFQNNQEINEAMKEKKVAPWMSRTNMSGRLERWPERSELNKNINESLIVEFYNK